MKIVLTPNPYRDKQFRTVQQARKILAETTLPVSDIASSLGYESVTYFEKVFRKHTETSPLKYRRQYLKDTQTPAVRPQSHIGEQ